MPKPASTVHRIHFEDHDPRDFERLVFAYLLRTDRWVMLDWYGQVGSDLGRDIWGVRDRDDRRKHTVCIQCANRLDGDGYNLKRLIANRQDIFAAYLQMRPQKREEQ